MENTNVPEHVFISFSNADKNYVERITADLQECGISVWVDYEGLTAGTPDWESAIRDAIQRSYAVLLIASPASRQSLAVKGELSVAQSRNLVIYPLWVTGNQWIDCIPLEFSHSQYIDCRSDNYRTGLRKTIERLKEIIQTLTPPHYLVSNKRASESRSFNPRTRRASWRGIEVPGNSILIELPSAVVKARDRCAVIMNLLAYASVDGLLDDLYVHYLKDQYTPFCYGSSWVLVEESFGSHGVVLVDWSWLTYTDKTDYHPGIEARKEVPSHSPLAKGPFWRIVDTSELGAFGLAVHDERLLDVCRNDLKRFIYLRSLLEETDMDSFVPSEYEFRTVVGTSGGPVSVRPFVLRQKAPLSEREMERLFR